MLIKLALGNVRRSARDFSVYFMTLAFAVCLLYSFLASTDYLLALDLTAEQRLYYAKSGEVLVAFAVFVAVIFAFLIGYANVFLVRRRKREFGLYELLGMGHARVSCVLALESASVGIVSLIAGMALGVALSPLFGLVTAFVFGVPWTPVVTVSSAAAAQTALAFTAITLSLIHI
ncbi:FtsX-like permease family protein [Collinsella ihumii]|uniref:FtsX-like permease family protein n=1 Tax=Collinsella ihumii TaxID=1720204 RepID=UPI000830273E|nr:FtsX-like permease family protein [Collinsella ihumii]